MKQKIEVIYHIISGSEAVRHVPELITGLRQFDLPIYTLMTENAQRVISHFHLKKQPGHTLIDSYFDPALFPNRAPGLTLVAPATFNTMNKMSQGIADTLAHSLIAEAIGAEWPLVIAPALNTPLANHPQFKQSVNTLTEWGACVLPLATMDVHQKMASVPEIIAAVQSFIEQEQ